MTESDVTAARDLQSLEIFANSMWYPGNEFSSPPDLNKAVWQIPGPPVIPARMDDATDQLRA